MEKVTIVWTGPYSVDSVGKFIEEKDFGIYMITRRWGESEKVFYVELVYWESLVDRIDEHKKGWLWSVRGKINFWIGRFHPDKGRSYSYESAKDVEDLVICAYQPKFNNKIKMVYDGREITVTNLGNRGPLDQVIYSEHLRYVRPHIHQIGEIQLKCAMPDCPMLEKYGDKIIRVGWEYLYCPVGKEVYCLMELMHGRPLHESRICPKHKVRLESWSLDDQGKPRRLY